MTIAHTLPARRKWKCDVCGKIDFWDDAWSCLSSLGMDEACPEDIPTVCSDKCKLEFEYRLAAGKVKLPKLEIECAGFRKTRNRIGY